MTTIKDRLALGAAKTHASVMHGHRMSDGWASVPDDDGGATWFSWCADCGMAVSVQSITHKVAGCAYDTDCPGGHEED